DYNCVAPIIVDGRAWLTPDSRGRLSPRSQDDEGAPQSRYILRDARHPLLERNLKSKGGTIVPVTIELEGSQRELVITGPNTGGKTVALKTVGLVVLMAQSGIPVPASRMEAPVFDSVLADIGDYQSIEQNLSTFSAHVT